MWKSIGGAIGLGLAWFVFGASVGLIVFEDLVDPDGKMVDIWPAVLGYPGFFGGVTFFTVSRILERRCRFHEVPLPRALIWGALSGPVLTALFLLGMTTGVLGDFEGGRTPWLGIAQATGIMIPAFGIAGCFSVWMAKRVVEAS